MKIHKIPREQWAAKEARARELDNGERSAPEIGAMLAQEFGGKESANTQYIYQRRTMWRLGYNPRTKKGRKAKREAKALNLLENGVNGEAPVKRGPHKRRQPAPSRPEPTARLAHFCPVCGTPMQQVEEVLKHHFGDY